MLKIIRAGFVRGEKVKYISHLDLMKVFERALRRSQIPIAYSQGFNPHPQMVFGLPLSVGVTSQAEYADFEMSAFIEPQEFAGKLNRELPDGLKIVDAAARQSKDNIMASVSAAVYDVLVSPNVKTGLDVLEEKIPEFLSKPAIMVEKWSKQGVKKIDIKPMIHRLGVRFLENSAGADRVEAGLNDSDAWLAGYIRSIANGDMLPPSYDIDNIFCLSALISAGSSANLKPDLLATAFGEFLKTALDNPGYELKLVKIHRTRLFVRKGGELTDPLDKSVL